MPRPPPHFCSSCLSSTAPTISTTSRDRGLACSFVRIRVSAQAQCTPLRFSLPGPGALTSFEHALKLCANADAHSHPQALGACTGATTRTAAWSSSISPTQCPAASRWRWRFCPAAWGQFESGMSRGGYALLCFTTTPVQCSNTAGAVAVACYTRPELPAAWLALAGCTPE